MDYRKQLQELVETATALTGYLNEKECLPYDVFANYVNALEVAIAHAVSAMKESDKPEIPDYVEEQADSEQRAHVRRSTYHE